MSLKEYTAYDFTPLLTLDLERLPKLMRDVVVTHKQYNNVPLELSLPSVLAVSNVAVQHRYDVDPMLFSRKPISLFIMSLSPSGTSKSAVLDSVTEGVREHIRDLNFGYREEVIRYKIAEKAYEEQLKEEQKKYTSNGMINIGLPPVPPEDPCMIIKKATTNGFMNILANRGFISIMTSEGGEFFSSHSMRGKNQNTGTDVELNTLLTNLFDGQMLQKNTGIDRSALFDRRGNVYIMSQDEPAREFLSNRDYAAQGITPRFLIVQSETYVKPIRTHSEEERRLGQQHRHALSEFNDHVFNLLANGVRYADQTRVPYELDCEVIGYTDAAAELMTHYYNAGVRRFLTDLRDYPSYAHRVYEHMCRIAATFTAWDGRRTMDVADIESAIMINEWFVAHRVALEVAASVRNADLADTAQKVIAWMRRKNFSGTANDFRQRGAGVGMNKMDSRQINEILEEMLTTEKVVCQMIKHTNGRETAVFSLAQPPA